MDLVGLNLGVCVEVCPVKHFFVLSHACAIMYSVNFDLYASYFFTNTRSQYIHSTCGVFAVNSYQTLGWPSAPPPPSQATPSMLFCTIIVSGAFGSGVIKLSYHFITSALTIQSKGMKKQDQNGNVLFYILIAIAALAALSHAVSNSTRGGLSQISSEQAKLRASEVIEYGSVMANAVSQLRLRGVDVGDLCFDHASWGADDYDHGGCTDTYNQIFHPSGAGLQWANAPADAMDTGATPDNLWHIYGENEVDGVGTTCAASACADLILMTDELSQAVCIEINEHLGVENPAGAPPTDSAYGEGRYVGAFGYTQTIGDEGGGVNFKGKSAACFQRTDAPTKYAFYKVLLAR